MKNRSFIKILVILNLIGFPLFIFLSQMEQYAYANSSSSRVSVTVPDLNVRDDAAISGNIIGQVHEGDTFSIIKTKNNWDQIKFANHQTGWVYDAYVTPTETKEATVNAIVLNVRNQPSLFSYVASKLKLGAKVTVTEEQAGWAKIVTSSGVHGWVYEYYITIDKGGTNQLQASESAARGKTDAGQTTNPSQSMVPDMQTTPGFSQNGGSPLKNKTIVLDPGHGGYDGGTTSIEGTHEKVLTLETAKAVEQKLKNAGANVIMTRTNDTYIPLETRTNLSNQYKADAFISLHYNWSNDSAANGLTDFYYHQSKDDALASDILQEVGKTTSLSNDGTKFDNLEVLRDNSQPSTLIELGFVSNTHDDSLVESPSFHDKVAQGVYLGLLNYFSINKK